MNVPLPAALQQPVPRRPNDCVVEDWLSFLGHRWTALLLWHLSSGSKRFAELVDHLPGITANILNERLSTLTESGLIDRVELPGFPRRVSYALTSRGKGISQILDQVEIWADDSGLNRNCAALRE